MEDRSICCAECMYLLGSDTKNYYMCNVGKYDRIYNAYLCTATKIKVGIKAQKNIRNK